MRRQSVKVFDKTAHFLDRSQSAVYIEPQAEINAGVVCGLGVFPQFELDRRQSVEQIADGQTDQINHNWHDRSEAMCNGSEER